MQMSMTLMNCESTLASFYVRELPNMWSSDINANIVRNMERIKEGILPHFFETRLIHYMNLKKDQAYVYPLKLPLSSILTHFVGL